MTIERGLIKILVAGDPNVGKTSIVKKAVDNKFSPEKMPSSILEFEVINMGEHSKNYASLQVWDTAGQSKYWPYGRATMSNIDCYVLVYDKTKAETFDNLDYWKKLVKADDNNKKLIFIVGNKSDLSNSQVHSEKAMAWAVNNNAKFIETSAKNGSNISKLFMLIYEHFSMQVVPDDTHEKSHRRRLKEIFLGVR